MITKAKPTEREKIMDGLVNYTTGKNYKQTRQRAFLAGIKFYKEKILKNENQFRNH